MGPPQAPRASYPRFALTRVFLPSLRHSTLFSSIRSAQRSHLSIACFQSASLSAGGERGLSFLGLLPIDHSSLGGERKSTTVYLKTPFGSPNVTGFHSFASFLWPEDFFRYPLPLPPPRSASRAVDCACLNPRAMRIFFYSADRSLPVCRVVCLFRLTFFFSQMVSHLPLCRHAPRQVLCHFRSSSEGLPCFLASASQIRLLGDDSIPCFLRHAHDPPRFSLSHFSSLAQIGSFTNFFSIPRLFLPPPATLLLCRTLQIFASPPRPCAARNPIAGWSFSCAFRLSPSFCSPSFISPGNPSPVTHSPPMFFFFPRRQFFSSSRVPYSRLF